MTPQEILSHFPLPSVTEVKPVGSGWINVTMQVTTQGGNFVLQKLHDVIPDAAAEDMRVVTEHLSAQGMQVPRLVMTNEGTSFFRDADGGRWRVYPWIDGVIVDAVTGEAMAREAGRIVGEMHRHLAMLSYQPQGSIPHFHDTVYIGDELTVASSQLPAELQTIAQDILAQLPSVIINEGEKLTIHGDLKISNIVFDAAGKAVGVIDFDTLLWHYAAVDLGDAYRSWCNRTAEDDPQATFDVELFRAAEAGYAAGAGKTLTPDEIALHLRAVKQIAFELASRFLIDVVRDNYFGYDATRYATRRDANIARAIGQYHLALSIPSSL